MFFRSHPSFVINSCILNQAQIQKASNTHQTPVSNLMKAIAAVIVLVGAFNVYFKMQNGDQDVKKTIMLTIGGCVAFIAMSEALPLFFK